VDLVDDELDQVAGGAEPDEIALNHKNKTKNRKTNY
jgi:hypothetical protein